MTTATQKFQWAKKRDQNGDFQLVQEVRYGNDLCRCGHSWNDHWQPEPGGSAACWSTEKGRLDECHDFVFQNVAKIANLP